MSKKFVHKKVRREYRRLTDEDRKRMAAKVEKEEAKRKKIKKAKNKQRLEWSLNSFEGKQIRKMGFRAPREAAEPNWYKEYLKTDHWRGVKERYYKSKLPQKCYVCGSKKFDLHHKTYDRIGTEHLRDLVPLCRKHHAATHKLVKQGIDLLIAHTKIK